MCQRRVTFTIFVLWWSIYLVSSMSWEWTICNCYTWNRRKSCRYFSWCRKNATLERVHSWTFWKHCFKKTSRSIQTRISAVNSMPTGRASWWLWWTRFFSTGGKTVNGWRTLVRHTLTKWKLKGKTVTRYSFSPSSYCVPITRTSPCTLNRKKHAIGWERYANWKRMIHHSCRNWKTRYPLFCTTCNIGTWPPKKKAVCGSRQL